MSNYMPKKLDVDNMSRFLEREEKPFNQTKKKINKKSA